MIFVVGDIGPLVTNVVLNDAAVVHVVPFSANLSDQPLNPAHPASLTLLLIVIDQLKNVFDQFVAVFHTLIYAVFTTGFVLSSLYVPFHVLLFHAKSVAHKYNVWFHSVLCVIVALFEYPIPLLKQFAALVQLYFAVPGFASVCVNVIDIFAFFRVVDEFVALILGAIVSYTIHDALYAVDRLFT